MDAKKLYTEVQGEDPENFQAVPCLGYIALLANRLDDAQKWLTKAIELKSEETVSKALALTLDFAGMRYFLKREEQGHLNDFWRI